MSTDPGDAGATHDLIREGPTLEQFRRDVIDALRRNPPHLPPKYFYDSVGSELFEQITGLDEYYPTKAEREILTTRTAEIAAAIGPNALVVDAGSHLSKKVEPILEALDQPAGYIPIEISPDVLEQAVERLHDSFPSLPIHPMVADFTNALQLPYEGPPPARGVVFFPGSTIGNLERNDRRMFFDAFRALATDQGRIPGALLISTDLHKDSSIIEPAYNDAKDVTARFNKNVLVRMKRELGADVDPDSFEHRAVYDSDQQRIEMRLIAQGDQRIAVPPLKDTQEPFERTIADRDHIVTEYSHKFTADSFAAELAEAGFDLVERWTDAQERFAVNFAICRS